MFTTQKKYWGNEFVHQRKHFFKPLYHYSAFTLELKLWCLFFLSRLVIVKIRHFLTQRRWWNFLRRWLIEPLTGWFVRRLKRYMYVLWWWLLEYRCCLPSSMFGMFESNGNLREHYEYNEPTFEEFMEILIYVAKTEKMWREYRNFNYFKCSQIEKGKACQK